MRVCLRISYLPWKPNKNANDHKTHKLGRQSPNDHNCQIGVHLVWRSGLCEMYVNAQSLVRAGEEYSEEFEGKVSIHQGLVLIPLLFIIVLEALLHEFHSGVTWEDLYANGLFIIAESLKKCIRRLLTRKEAMQEKGLRVNAGKTKILTCGTGLFPCAICRTGVGSNRIFCNDCKNWVHKKCSGLKCLTKDPDYRSIWCQRTARPFDGRPQREVQIGPDKLEVVASFYYLGDMLAAAGGYELTTTHVKTTWKKFKELLPVLSSRHLSFKSHGHVYSSSMQSTMLYAGETWSLTKPNLQHLQQNDRAMIKHLSSCKTLSLLSPINYLRSLALRTWTSF